MKQTAIAVVSFLVIWGGIEVYMAWDKIKRYFTRNNMDVATKVAFAERCANCGCSFGAHKGSAPYAICPGHEGRMDWHNSPGTKFKGSGDFTPVEWGTAAKRTKS